MIKNEEILGSKTRFEKTYVYIYVYLKREGLLYNSGACTTVLPKSTLSHCRHCHKRVRWMCL